MVSAMSLQNIVPIAELVAISTLKNHPDNYRKHPRDQLEHIMASIKQNGFYKNIVIAQDSTILAGHGAVEAANELKIEHIPVVRLNIDPSDKRALRILAGDNEIANLVDVDDRKLTEILKELSGDPDGLLGTGFDLKQLANLVFVTRHATEIRDFDAAGEWVGLPSYQEQDLDFKNRPVIEISFETPESRDEFVNLIDLKIKAKVGDRKWSTTWPFTERNDSKSIKFESQDTINEIKS